MTHSVTIGMSGTGKTSLGEARRSFSNMPPTFLTKVDANIVEVEAERSTPE